MRVVLAAALVLLAACSVKVAGAPCSTDSNCPEGEYCVAGKCQKQPGGGGDGGGADGGDAGCTSDPGCSAAGATACAPADPNKTGVCVDVGGACLKVQQLRGCPSPAQRCESGRCTCPAASCLPGETSCAGGALVVTCALDVDGGCGFFPDAGRACPSPMVCGRVDGGAACNCPFGGSPAVGQCCSPESATACVGTELLRCVLDAGAQTWESELECASWGERCGSPWLGAPAQCLCSPVSGAGPYFADPWSGELLDAGDYPTGAATPPWCRFARLGDALAAAGRAPLGSNPVVAAVWPMVPGWEPSTEYPAGDTVRPTVPNDHVYLVVSDGGTSGSAEPGWVKDGGFVQDGTVSWQDQGDNPGDSTYFMDETFPLTVPRGVKLAGWCLTDAGCEPQKIAVLLTSNVDGGTSGMLRLAADSSLTNLVVGNIDAPPASTAVGCDDGTVKLIAVGIFGEVGASATRLSHALQVTGNCAVDGLLLFVGETRDSAIQMRTSRSVFLSYSGVGVLPLSLPDGGPDLRPVGGGIENDGGVLVAENTSIAGSQSYGLALTAPSATAALRASTVAYNRGPGIALLAGAAALDAGTSVLLNGRGPFAAQTYPGILMLGGSLSVSGSLGSGGKPITIGYNGEDGVQVMGGSASIVGADLVGNGDEGLMVGSSSVSLRDSLVRANVQNGILIFQGLNVLVQGTTVAGNQGPGIVVGNSPTGGNVSAVIDSCQITGNRGPGVVVRQPSGATTTVSMRGNQVSENARLPGLLNPAGMVFQTTATLPQFEGNSVFGNGGAEISVRASYGGGLPWPLNAGGCAAANRVACYSGIGSDVGVENLNSVLGVTVDATNMQWGFPLSATGPQLNRDYTGLVTVTPHCGTWDAGVCP